MKSMFFAVVALFVGISPLSALSETVVYKLTMVLKVPRVYENTQSLGYRKNQTQKVYAYVYVDKSNLDGGEPRIEVYDCINKTHKVGGSYVTYSDVSAQDVMWRYIGSNKTGVFKNTNIRFALDLDPSYNIGADEPDNTLVIMLSGFGTTEKSIKGMVTGQIGCGCRAYGHKSPTRTVDCSVSDIVPLSGTFTMKRVGTCK